MKTHCKLKIEDSLKFVMAVLVMLIIVFLLGSCKPKPLEFSGPKNLNIVVGEDWAILSWERHYFPGIEFQSSYQVKRNGNGGEVWIDCRYSTSYLFTNLERSTNTFYVRAVYESHTRPQDSCTSAPSTIFTYLFLPQYISLDAEPTIPNCMNYLLKKVFYNEISYQYKISTYNSGGLQYTDYRYLRAKDGNIYIKNYTVNAKTSSIISSEEVYFIKVVNKYVQICKNYVTNSWELFPVHLSIEYVQYLLMGYTAFIWMPLPSKILLNEVVTTTETKTIFGNICDRYKGTETNEFGNYSEYWIVRDTLLLLEYTLAFPNNRKEILLCTDLLLVGIDPVSFPT